MSILRSEHDVRGGGTTASSRQTPEARPGDEVRHERRDGLARSESAIRCLLEVLPAAAYTTDAQGLITAFNLRAVEFWGREPKRNDPRDRY